MELSLIFAERLQRVRREHGYTQRELAELVGYSEKAVSKWERGGAIPPAEVLLELAAALHTTIGALLEGAPRAKYFLGIDGGGTKTAFLLVDEAGVEVASCKLGPSNPNDIGMENCLSLLRQGILKVTAGIKCSEIAAFAGIAGGGISGDNVEHIRRSLAGYGFAFVENGSDAENSLEVALHGGDGVAVIAGTGTIAFAQSGGKRHRVAGWGYLLDGGGSGYDIARDGFSAALRAIDGRGEETLLTALLEKKLGKTVPDAIPDIYNGGKRFIASFAPVVFEAAEAGDAVALSIIERNAAALAEMIIAARRYVENKDTPVVICGGLAHSAALIERLMRPHLTDDIKLTFSLEEMVHGAATRARRRYDEPH